MWLYTPLVVMAYVYLGLFLLKPEKLFVFGYIYYMAKNRCVNVFAQYHFIVACASNW